MEFEREQIAPPCCNTLGWVVAASTVLARTHEMTARTHSRMQQELSASQDLDQDQQRRRALTWFIKGVVPRCREVQIAQTELLRLLGLQSRCGPSHSWRVSPGRLVHCGLCPHCGLCQPAITLGLSGSTTPPMHAQWTASLCWWHRACGSCMNVCCPGRIGGPVPCNSCTLPSVTGPCCQRAAFHVHIATPDC